MEKGAGTETRVFLYAGTIFARQGRHTVVTVLGSCISVCLWDPRLRIGGINHFMLPLWNGEGLPSPRYGNIAIEKLIDRMVRLGSFRKGLKAKVFGGASTARNSKGLLSVGDRNIITAEDLLREEGIPIISADVGGSNGRKLIFDTETGSVLVKKLAMPQQNPRE